MCGDLGGRGLGERVYGVFVVGPRCVGAVYPVGDPVQRLHVPLVAFF